MKKLILSLLLLAAFTTALAQDNNVTAFDWEPNPVTIHGSVLTLDATLGGNVFLLGRNALAATHYEYRDTTWIRAYYSPDLDLVARNMHHDRPGKFTFAGLAADTTGFSACLARIDSSDGAYNWAKKYNVGMGSNFHGSIQTSTGSLAYGQWFDFAGSKGFVCNLDMAGDTIWTASYAAGENLEINDVHPLGSGYLLVGSYVAPGAGGDHVFLMRIDGLGTPVWAKHYVSGRTEWVTDSEMDVHGNVYLAVSSDDTTQLAGAMRLMSADSAGNFRFGTSLTMDVYNESFSISYWPNEGIFLSGTTSDGSVGPGVLARFDTQGLFKWAKSYLPGGYAEIQSISHFGEKGLVVAVADENATYGVTIIEMDSSGKLWSPCSYAVESPMVTGYNPTVLPVTVTRSSGCAIDNLSLSEVAPHKAIQEICWSISAAEPMHSVLNVFPQPMLDHAEIVLPEGYSPDDVNLDVFDMNGRLIQVTSSKTANGLRLERGTLPAGLYTCRVQSSGEWIGSVRIVML